MNLSRLFTTPNYRCDMPNRILIVDDEVGIRLSFKELLQNQSQEVHTAASFAEAEALLAEMHFNVVIVDIGLNGREGEDGMKLLEHVKKTSPDTGTIMVTGYGNPASMEKAYNMGAAFYFEKPVSIVSLQKALSSMGA